MADLPTRGFGVYADTGTGHWVGSVSGNGRIVELEDNSLWEIAPLDQLDTVLWLPLTDITVLDGDNPLYPYKLVNTDDGEVAEAKLLSK